MHICSIFRLPYFLFFITILSYTVYTDFTHIAASNTGSWTDDVTN